MSPSHTQITAAKALGYVCHREWIAGRGWLGGDGCRAYVVRDAGGNVVDRVGTATTARRAWRDALAAIAKAKEVQP